ncbi:hypothetical protein NPIL_411351 [Nephila pilipes]|uniref:Uncharacterized protein n=1 Tax=Nephila pilipes TaxID=299642 RepID=A0A8X6JZS9_NEPPI|nr:hypothetical protein NPIL_411351 [Nephila pilipes]
MDKFLCIPDFNFTSRGDTDKSECLSVGCGMVTMTNALIGAICEKMVLARKRWRRSLDGIQDGHRETGCKTRLESYKE